MKIKGVALIVVLVFTFVFSAIVLAIVLTSTTAYRRAAFYHDKLVAQQLAEIGIQNALNTLNYTEYDNIHYYNLSGGNLASNNDIWLKIPSGTTSMTSLGTADTYYTIPATSLNIPNALANDGVTVHLQLTASDQTSNDTLIATGTYRGRQVIITAGIRSNTDASGPVPGSLSFPFPPTANSTSNLYYPLNDSTNSDTKGISEAFNKHVIYANTVSGTTTQVSGNITTTTTKPTFPPSWTDVTWTQTGVVSLPILSTAVQPVVLPVITWDRTYTDGSRAGGTFVGDGYGTYNAGTYTFTVSTLSDFNLYFSTGTKTPTVNIDSLTTINKSIGCTTSLAINTNKTLGTGVVFKPSNSFTIGAVTINGDLIVEDVSLTLNTNNTKIYGAVVCDNSITISGTGIYIEPSVNSSTREAAILVYPSSGNPIVTINSSPTIILGSNQKSAVFIYNQSGGSGTLDVESAPNITLYSGTGQNSVFMVYSTVGAATVTIGVTNPVDFTTTGTPIINLEKQATIVAYSQSNQSNVSLGSSKSVKINGLIYSYGNSSSGITLANASTAVNGSLITSGTVLLSNGTLVYDDSLYKNNNANIYSGFTGGRRVYLPTSWSVQW